MQYKIILFVVLIIHIGCSKNESEIDLLNKVDPIGYYGDHTPKGLIYSVDELFLPFVSFSVAAIASTFC